MQRRIIAILLIAVLVTVTACKSDAKKPASDYSKNSLTQDINPDTVKEKKPDEAFVNAYDTFALQLFSQLTKDNDKNVMISPLSIMEAVTMAANGANGKTLTEIENVMSNKISMEDFSNYIGTYNQIHPSTQAVKFKIANSLWLNNTITSNVKSAYLSRVKGYFDAGVYSIDFDNNGVNKVNNWVSDNTDQMIKEIIKEFKKDNVALLINTICFDGMWESVYQKQQVREGSFTQSNGDNKKCDMMYSEEYQYLKGKGCQGFIKNYKGGKMSFVALLPDENNDIDTFVSTLTPEEFQKIMKNKTSEKVYTSIPKFSSDYDIELTDTFKKLGIKTAFSENADFSGIMDNPLYISAIIHKTHIDVAEKGTRAGAATAVTVDKATAMPNEQPKEVYLTRPFVYAIYDNENNIPVFIGVVKTIK